MDKRCKFSILTLRYVNMNQKVMNNLSYGIFVVTAKEGEKDNGCIVNTGIQVTTEPNQIVLALNKNNYTHDMIMRTKKLNLSILSEKATIATIQNFGFQSGKSADKFVEFPFERSANGITYVAKECNGYISAEVTQTVDLGTHTLFIAQVTDGDVIDDAPSATYAYYHAHIKQTAKPSAKKGWICTVCGYIYEGEVLPPDFICPICGHPATDFEPLK